MSSGAEARVIERFGSAPVLAEPFPHCVVDDVFPGDFYEDLVDHWPLDEEFVPLTATGRTQGPYEQRRAFWSASVAAWLMSAAFARCTVGKFARELAQAGVDAGSASLPTR